MTSNCEPQPPTPGRPRDDQREQAILDTALELLEEVGYDNLTMDLLAVRAHASKATIYRRWNGKADVVVEALRRRKLHADEDVDLGDLRAELYATMAGGDPESNVADAALLMGVARAMRTDLELSRLMREQIFEQKQAVVGRIVERAVARGELAPETDPTTMCEAVQAMVLAHLMLDDHQLDDRFCAHVIEDVALPLLGVAPYAHRPRSTADGVTPVAPSTEAIPHSPTTSYPQTNTVTPDPA